VPDARYQDVATPSDRLPYVDCTYIEDVLSGREPTADTARSVAAPPPAGLEAKGQCALCRQERRAALSSERLDVLQFRFWSDDHRRFDHIGFARAVMAACAP
jgi:hypothetical protein